MLYEINSDSEKDLYNYFVENIIDVPYYITVNFECWRESMFNDCDCDGNPLFKELKTIILRNDKKLNGFIQMGLTNYIFDSDGNKDFSNSYKIIRNIHFLPNACNAEILMNESKTYFGSEQTVYAFFHYFGMSCYANQGKLHSSQFHIENLLSEYGYGKEHENIYYSKDLAKVQFMDILEITFYCSINEQTIDFIYNGEKIGGCELNLKFNERICFLKWIYIDGLYAHQGLGTKCMNKLFYFLQEKGFLRLDTDTADYNINAQGYYIKTGFIDKGRMRSYYTK